MANELFGIIEGYWTYIRTIDGSSTAVGYDPAISSVKIFARFGNADLYEFFFGNVGFNGFGNAAHKAKCK